MWLLILLFVSTSATFCDHYDEGPIDVSLNQNSGTIEMSETLEILFDLRINADCFGWCHIFAIGGRYPLLYTYSGAFVSEFVQYPVLYENHVDNVNDFYASMIDGSYHSFHLKYTETERIIKFDDITYIHTTDVSNNIIEHRSYDISTVWGSTIQHATNATIKNLCINPRYVVKIVPNTTQSQVETTQSNEWNEDVFNQTELTTNTLNTEDGDANAYAYIAYWVVCVCVLFLIFMILIMILVGRERHIRSNRYKEVKPSVDESDANDQEKVKEWLIMIGLEQYYDVFIRNGLCSLGFVRKIRNEKDLYNIGITLKGHQIVIMTEIGNLKNLVEHGNEEMDEGIHCETKDEGNIDFPDTQQ